MNNFEKKKIFFTELIWTFFNIFDLIDICDWTWILV